MKKILITTLVLTLILPVFNIPSVSADQLADSNDIFNVTAPLPNTKVNGISNISWRIYDNNQSTVPYSIKLYDQATCKDAYFGDIVTNGNANSNSTADNTYSWDTHSTNINSNLSDGLYCVKICAIFRNVTTPYSACNARIVAVTNNQSNAPVITSNPTNLVIHESDSWQYQIATHDYSGRGVQYYFVYGANFLDIDTNTGLIKTNSSSKVLSNGVTRADYNIIVKADDGLYSPATQQFTLSIIKDPAITISSSSQTQSSQQSSSLQSSVSSQQSSSSTSISSSQSSSNQPINYQISFTKPAVGDTFSGKNNPVIWNTQGFDFISNVILDYSSDQQTWSNIFTTGKNATLNQVLSTNSYTWDVSQIKDGNYYLRLTITDGKVGTVTKESSQYIIKNINSNTEQILINNLQPGDQSILNTNLKEITGTFVPSVNQTIDPKSLKVSLDTVDISSNCSVKGLVFTCSINQDLNKGKHQIGISISDTKQYSSNFISTFTYDYGSSLTTSSVQSYPSSYPIITLFNHQFVLSFSDPNTVFLLIVCSFILLILFLIFSFLRGRGNRRINRETVSSTTVGNNYLDPSVLSSYNTTTTTENSQDLSSLYNQFSNYQPYTPPVGANKKNITSTETVIDQATFPAYTPNYTTGDVTPIQTSTYTDTTPIDSTTTTQTTTGTDQYIEPTETDVTTSTEVTPPVI